MPVIQEEKVKAAMEFLLNMTQLISEMTFQKLEQIVLNEELRTSEERYRLFFANSMDGILLTLPTMQKDWQSYGNGSYQNHSQT
jgi:phage-related protein